MDDINYEKLAMMMKAIANPNRMKIVDILSCGSQCACDVLVHFDFTQPTLSHHMKILEDAGVVIVSKEGKWSYYSLEATFVTEFTRSVMQLFTSDNECICINPSEPTKKGCL